MKFSKATLTAFALSSAATTPFSLAKETTKKDDQKLGPHLNIVKNGPISKHGQALPLDQIPSKTLKPLDMNKVNAEDAKQGLYDAPRYAIVEDIDDVSMDIWENVLSEDGTSSEVWRYEFKGDPSATKSLAFWFEDANLPEGVELYIIDMENEDNYLGPFTSAINELNTPATNGQNGFMTPALEGTHHAVIELDLNGADREDVELVLSKVVNGYKELSHFGQTKGDRHLSGSCNVDVACSEGNDWTDEINSVGAMTFTTSRGGFVCTGTMMNNGKQDRTPYFLTAYHCGLNNNQVASTLNVYWNFQTTVCGDSNPNGRRDQVTSAATFLTGYASTDMTLLRLNSQPPAAYNVAYAGWDRSGTLAVDGVVGIHHPRGDEKRISVENDATNVTGYGGVGNTHIRVADWDRGTTESGSSGSALFDKNHRVIGQLHGGDAACSGSGGNNGMADWYGRLSVSWNNSALSDYLDPNGQGMQTMDTLPGLTKFFLTLVPDRWPQETTTTLSVLGGSGGDIVEYFVEPSYGQRKEVALYDGAKYQLCIRDSYGDGMNNDTPNDTSDDGAVFVGKTSPSFNGKLAEILGGEFSDETKCVCFTTEPGSEGSCEEGKEGKGRRRHLTGLDEEAFGSDELLVLESKCGTFEYDLRLHVDDHIGIVAVPVLDDDGNEPEEGCPSLYIHFDATNTMSKAIQPIVKEDQLLLEEELFPLQTNTDNGSLSLSKILKSFEKVQDQDGKYDLLVNNCATFLLHFASEAGVKVDTGVVYYTAKALSKYGLLEKLMDRNDFQVDNVSTIKQQELVVENFVKQYVKTYGDKDIIVGF